MRLFEDHAGSFTGREGCKSTALVPCVEEGSRWGKKTLNADIRKRGKCVAFLYTVTAGSHTGKQVVVASLSILCQRRQQELLGGS